MYITEDLKHAVLYFGQRCAFWVRSVQCLQVPVCDLSAAAPPFPGAHADTSGLSQGLSSLDISGVSDSGDALSTPLSATPTKHSGADAWLDGSQSPAADTPEQTERKRPEQFCTPVTSDRRRGEKKGCPRFVKVTAQTQFVRRERRGEDSEAAGRKVEKVTFDSLGGLDKQIEQIRQCCLRPLQALQHDSSAGRYRQHR